MPKTEDEKTLNQIPKNGTSKGEWNLPPFIWFAPAVALLIAILPLPYTYYTGLRWLIAGAAAFLAWKEFEANRSLHGGFLWAFGGVVILFNPIVPVYLTKSIWAVLDLAAAGIFVFHWNARKS